MDTYWLAGTEDERAETHLPRLHLTGASVHYLREHSAPARFVYPAASTATKVPTPATSVPSTNEALIVEQDFSFPQAACSSTPSWRRLGHPANPHVRALFSLRGAGFEIDMRCQVCAGKGCGVSQAGGLDRDHARRGSAPQCAQQPGLDPQLWSGFTSISVWTAWS